MTPQPSGARVHLDWEQAHHLAKLLREIEQFLDECDESVEEAMATHFGRGLQRGPVLPRRRHRDRPRR